MINFELEDFDVSIFDDIDYTDNVFVHTHGIWMGPKNEETEAARIEGLRRSWQNAPTERREAAAEQMKKNRWTGPTHQNGMTAEHKANLSRSRMGNQNARKRKETA